jgi:predicted transcriptional regulator of viral defense system
MRAKSTHSTPAAQPVRGRVARLLEERQARGKLVCELDAVAREEDLSRLAARRQLERLVPKVIRLPGRPSLFLTVPPEDRPRGAPPVAAWLNDYMSQRTSHYYVGLLSAAALHGSSSQVPMATQVIVPEPVRPFELGRLRIEFFTKQRADRTPLAALPGLASPMNVSTPAATLLDLVAFSRRVGGMTRVLEIAVGLKSKLTAHDIRDASRAGASMPVLQRTGYLLEHLGCQSHARVVENFLTPTCTPVPLQAGAPVDRAQSIERWRVLDNVGFVERARALRR